MKIISLPLLIAALLAISFPAKAQVVPSCYIEGSAGQNISAVKTSAGVDLSTSGLVGGGAIGCDWKLSGFVIGGFGRYEFSSADGSIAALKLDTEGQWTAALRAGMMINPSVLAYGFVGYSGSAIDLSGFADDATRGIAFGAGAEIQLWIPQLSAKLEYQQTRFSDETIMPGLKAEPVSHIARVGLVYRFTGSVFGGQ